MPQKLKLATAQGRTLDTTAETLHALDSTTRKAAQSGVHLILFPEAYLGGYPRTCNFGSSIGARDPIGREQFLQYFQAAVDLGDTPSGAGDDWINKKLPIAKGFKYRGDGTREELEKIARDTGVFVVTGLVEKAAGSLYCSVVYVCPREGVLGKRRKVMPTGTERMIWAQGSPSTLRAVTTTINGVKLTLAAAICWENYMPLLRQSLYSQNVNLYLAPTADGRDTWLALLRTIGCESRAFVLSSNQCVQRKHLPAWVNPTWTRGEVPSHNGPKDTRQPMEHPPASRLRRQSTITADGNHEICWPVAEEDCSKDSAIAEPTTNGIEHAPRSLSTPEVRSTSPRLQKRRESIVLETPEHHEILFPITKPGRSKASSVTSRPATAEDDEFVARGGSSIISPLGEVLAGPLWEVEDFIAVEADFEDCERGRLDLDVAGSYSRSDAFKLHVEGLDLNPPP